VLVLSRECLECRRIDIWGMPLLQHYIGHKPSSRGKVAA
jgi:hypothetical protein